MPVNVDAVLFWMVYDVEKAALEVNGIIVDHPLRLALREREALEKHDDEGPPEQYVYVRN